MLVLLCLLAGCGLSVGVCLGTNAFLGLQWLYLLPLTFVGGTLLGVLIVALFLCVACGVVDMKVLPDKDSKFYRRMTYLYIDALTGYVDKYHNVGFEVSGKPVNLKNGVTLQPMSYEISQMGSENY